jgi:hypothetical protein
MRASLTKNPLPFLSGEVVISTEQNRAAIHRAVRAGKLRKLAFRIYTSNLTDAPKKIIRANCWAIAGALFPQALISDRTAIENRPAEDGSIFLITQKRGSDLELPGIAFRPRSGHGPIEGSDTPFLGGLWMSSQARALMDNLRPSRQRSHVRSTFTREELEEYLDRMLRNSGAAAVNRLRDQAREIAPSLGMTAQAEKLSAIIGGMMGTVDGPLASQVGISRSKGLGYDPDRLELFEHLRAHLASHHFTARSARPGNSYLPFFESYFSNFIEGTEFEVGEAYEIVYDGIIPEERPNDAHDILGTYQIVSNSEEMGRVAKDASEFIDILRYRHSVILSGRRDMNPGVFKSKVNRSGESRFVEPDLVQGTLLRGFELIPTLMDPMARAIYMMFLVSEVHPFADGNGRIARVMMNAELHAKGKERIIIPNVFRTEYLQSLKALTHNQRADGLVSVMDYAQRFVAGIDFSDYAKAVIQLQTCNAFSAPADAMGGGDKLILSEGADAPRRRR